MRMIDYFNEDFSKKGTNKIRSYITMGLVFLAGGAFDYWCISTMNRRDNDLRKDLKYIRKVIDEVGAPEKFAEIPFMKPESSEPAGGIEIPRGLFLKMKEERERLKEQQKEQKPAESINKNYGSQERTK